MNPLRESMNSLRKTMKYSRKFTGVLKQTAAIALLYNAMALTLACLGLFSPLGAVVAMLVSFLSLLASISRLRESRDSWPVSESRPQR